MSDILSFGKLLRRCAEVINDDAQRTNDLHELGLPMEMLYRHKAAEEWKVRLSVYSQNMQFRLLCPGQSPELQITGTMLDGKLYSGYSGNIRPGTYHKRWFERFWPYYMPDGVKQQALTPVTIRHLDGKSQAYWRWMGGRRGRSGDLQRPNRDNWSQLWMCDSDNGKIVADHLDFVRKSQEIRMESTLGWFPYSVSEEDFYNSFRELDGMDMGAMQALAQRAVAAGKHIAQTCKGWKVRVFPASRSEKWNRQANPVFHGGDPAIVHVRVEGASRRMGLPTVLAYHPQSERYVCMHIPPVGNKYLDFEDRNVRTRSPLIRTDKPHERRTYTGLLACDLRKTEPALLQMYGYGMDESHPLVQQEEKKLFNFGRSNDHVMCRGYRCDHQMTQAGLQYPVAMTPEDVAALMEANELIESLPLC